jgi:hypothetical protein
MPTSTPPRAPEGDEPDVVVLVQTAAALAQTLCGALPAWVEACVTARAGERAPELEASTAGAGRAAAGELGPALEDLLTLDIDQQPTTPLALLRSAVRYPTQVLSDAGIPAVVRDREAERLFPDDLYDLTPAAFADFGPEAHEAGLLWGAAKAKVHLSRHRQG